MRPYYIFNYSKFFVNSDIVLPKINYNSWHLNEDFPASCIHSDGLNFLSEIDFSIKRITLFTGNDKTSIHSDESTRCFALNYAWNSSSKMRWYRIARNKKIFKTVKLTEAGSIYAGYQADQVELIEEIVFPIFRLLLVRIDIPHEVINTDKSVRYCLSLRGGPQLSKWEDAVEYFRPFLINGPATSS